MNLNKFFSQLRDHYVQQFQGFVGRQRSNHPGGAAEVKFLLSEESGLFRRFYCADFFGNDGGGAGIVEFDPEHILVFDPIAGSFGKSALSIERLRWDDVTLLHDLAEIPSSKLEAWFERWFDPEDARYMPGADNCCIIHSLLVQPGRLDIDFGTAPPEALWDMLELLETSGAATIDISSSRTQ